MYLVVFSDFSVYHPFIPSRLCVFCYLSKVRSLFKDGKQTAGCTEFRTETGLCSLVSVQKLEHPAVCLPTLKRERTLGKMI